jgi:hypothetical protein
MGEKVETGSQKETKAMITPAGSKLLTYNLCMHLLLMNHNGRKIPRMMITHAGHGNWKKKKKKKNRRKRVRNSESSATNATKAF